MFTIPIKWPIWGKRKKEMFGIHDGIINMLILDLFTFIIANGSLRMPSSRM